MEILIKFSKYFQYVLAVELEIDTYNLLQKNIDKFNINNIITYNNDYVDIMEHLIQDIIYIDF